MTTKPASMKVAYKRSGLSFLGITFRRAMDIPAIRISLECAAKASTKGKPAPMQPALI